MTESVTICLYILKYLLANQQTHEKTNAQSKEIQQQQTIEASISTTQTASSSPNLGFVSRWSSENMNELLIV